MGDWIAHGGELLFVTGGGRVSAHITSTDVGYRWGIFNPLLGLLGYTAKGETPTLVKAQRSVEAVFARRRRQWAA